MKRVVYFRLSLLMFFLGSKFVKEKSGGYWVAATAPGQGKGN